MTIDTTTSAYGDAGRGRPVPKYNIGGSPPEFGPGKAPIRKMMKDTPRSKKRGSKTKGMNIGGLVDYYKDII